MIIYVNFVRGQKIRNAPNGQEPTQTLTSARPMDPDPKAISAIIAEIER
uniref:Uncharacterized protein n=1 Tax=Phenylobacterium glaciei TaxID=2803784 RepID=A0A974P5B0_9CAUL|nr:hypothetical protein JKL49_07120 [Phenylobacterium glaciei]